MSEAFGPQGKPIRRPTHDEQLEHFEKAFGFQREPEPEFEPERIEAAWGDANRKSMYAEYFKRHPEARPPKPKPREIRKIGQIAPGVDGGEYVVKLLEELKTVLANYAIFEEKVAALEAKLPPDPCKDKGPNHRMIDGVCVEVRPGMLDRPTASPPPQGMSKDSAVVDTIMSKTIAKGKLFTKRIELNSGWTILSGASDGAH